MFDKLKLLLGVKPKCDMCRRKLTAGETGQEGFQGAGIKLEGGRMVYLCRSCLWRYGVTPEDLNPQKMMEAAEEAMTHGQAGSD